MIFSHLFKPFHAEMGSFAKNNSNVYSDMSGIFKKKQSVVVRKGENSKMAYFMILIY
mgnify:CR=1 FL=1